MVGCDADQISAVAFEADPIEFETALLEFAKGVERP
jgi:hypothetical protein